MEIIEFEKIKKSETPSTEGEIKENIKESLKLSPFFEKMTAEEQEQVINETYENCYKEKKEKEGKLAT